MQDNRMGKNKEKLVRLSAEDLIRFHNSPVYDNPF
jgi:hypothetical protein